MLSLHGQRLSDLPCISEDGDTQQLQDAGAGEIVINSVDRDGVMQGYDLELAAQVKEALKVPLTIMGGAGTLDHLAELIAKLGVVGAAAGSLLAKGRP